MGLTSEDYARIVSVLGREPNITELGMFAVMWSEHCGYRHSRPVLRMLPTTGARIMQGPGENAGVIDIGGGLAVVMKVESHNHPSAIEPYQGAATGVGGILRDIFAMGARPVALLDWLAFGPLDNDRNRFLLDGVVSGIAAYGNCTGVPTVAGEVRFHESFSGNPLVNVMCVGLVEADRVVRGVASGVGNDVVMAGSTTGRDGIHGCTFASEELSEKSEERRPAVQVGDPFTGKLLIEACLEVARRGLVVGIQDMGAAGITSSSSEMAARGGCGMEIDLDRVARREEGMTPYEVVLSESQERMLLVPRPGRTREVLDVFARWGVDARVVGRVTDDGMITMLEKGGVAARVPARELAHAPTCSPEAEMPSHLAGLRRLEPGDVPCPPDLGRALLSLLSSHTIADKSWVYTQYDHMVQTNTVVVPGDADASVLWVKPYAPARTVDDAPGGSEGPAYRGIALTIDGNPVYTYLDPEEGGKQAVAEAARNLACVGATPLAITDCLNFGTPSKPDVFWSFVHAVKGMAEASRVLGTPVVGGNVSFYNETNGAAIYPAPVVGMLGLVADVRLLRRQGFPRAGGEETAVVVLGLTKPEVGGSEYLRVVHGRVAGLPPRVDLDAEAALVRLLVDLGAAGVIASAHDCSDGGLLVALAECCVAGGVGAEVDLARVPVSGSARAGTGDLRPDILAFSESQARAVVSCPRARVDSVLALCARRGVPAAVVGRIGGRSLVVTLHGGRLVNLDVGEMSKAWKGSLAETMA